MLRVWESYHYKLCAGGLALMLGQAGLAHASPITDLTRAMQRIDRQICARLKDAKCGHRAQRPAAIRKRAHVGRVKPVKVSEPKVSSAGVPEASPVLPRLKPSRIAPTESVDVSPVIPRLKPAEILAHDQVAVTPVAPAAQVSPPPVVKLKPERKVAMAPSPVQPPADPSLVNPMPDGTLAGERCMAHLREMNVRFSPAATLVSSGVCSVFEPVTLTSMTVSGREMKFPDEPLLTCGFAARLASWIAEQAAPSVKVATGSSLTSLGTGPGYQCRGRNGDSSAKLIEHAFGNAVDIEYLGLSDGRKVHVETTALSTAMDSTLLNTLRGEGCTYFTTVLGPGTNAAHAHHFHFDLERRGKKGNHKLCQ